MHKCEEGWVSASHPCLKPQWYKITTKIHEAAPSPWKQSTTGWKASSIGLPAGPTKDQSGREANSAAAWLQATLHSTNRKLNPKLNESAWKQKNIFLPRTNISTSIWVSVPHISGFWPVWTKREYYCCFLTSKTAYPQVFHTTVGMPQSACHSSTVACGRGWKLEMRLTFTMKAKINVKIMNFSNLPSHTYLLLSR